MRVVMAMMKHETNTFSPIPTPYARFEAWGVHRGADAIALFERTNMTLSAYIRLAKAAGAEIALPIAAEAMPSGPVTAEAYERLTAPILEAVANGCDAVMLDLHGAMAAENTDDGEGTLLDSIRALAPKIPICVTLDFHCNLTERMVANADVIVGYKTYPHVDMFDAGAQAGAILLRMLRGECRPVMAWGQAPLLSQTLKQGTDDEPMRSTIALVRELEAEGGVLSATVFGGFALADIRDAGASALCIADGDRARAQAATDRLLARLWADREEHLYRHEPLEMAMARAKALEEGPILLLDHADNTGSGGAQDVMTVVEEALRQGLGDVAVAAIWDPAAVQEMMRAGVGATLTIALGGKTDMPSIGERGRPLTLTGRVKLLSDGEWIVRGPMYQGMTVRMGPTAVFETAGIEIVVVSNHHEPWDRGVFTSVGIDPSTKKYLILKSRIHYRAGFAPLAKHTIACDGVGVTTSDNRLLKYRKVRRPIFPLDRLNEAPR